MRREGVDAAGDFVSWDVAEMAGPDGVDGPEGLEVSADPFDPIVADLALGHFDGIVDHPQADALVHQFGKLLEMRDGHVPIAAVAEDDDGGGPVEGVLVLRPLMLVDLAIDAGHVFVEGFGQEHVAGVLLVLGEAVARLAGEEDDLLPVGKIGALGEAGALLGSGWHGEAADCQRGNGKFAGGWGHFFLRSDGLKDVVSHYRDLRRSVAESRPADIRPDSRGLNGWAFCSIAREKPGEARWFSHTKTGVG